MGDQGPGIRQLHCDYSCPCQFNALPSHGHCRGLAVFDIEQGFHGATRLDGLKCAAHLSLARPRP